MSSCARSRASSALVRSTLPPRSSRTRHQFLIARAAGGIGCGWCVTPLMCKRTPSEPSAPPLGSGFAAKLCSQANARSNTFYHPAHAAESRAAGRCSGGAITGFTPRRQLTTVPVVVRADGGSRSEHCDLVAKRQGNRRAAPPDPPSGSPGPASRAARSQRARAGPLAGRSTPPQCSPPARALESSRSVATKAGRHEPLANRRPSRRGSVATGLLAVALALVLPSDEAAARGDLVLAVLVALTALGIAPSEPWELRSRWKTVLALSLLPFASWSRSPGR